MPAGSLVPASAVALLATLASGGGGTFGISGEIVWIVLLAAADLLLADTLLPCR